MIIITLSIIDDEPYVLTKKDLMKEWKHGGNFQTF